MDGVGGLGVVEVEGYGDGGGGGGSGGGLGEEGAGVGLGPGEEEEHGWGAFCGRGADGGEDAFEVVLWVGKRVFSWVEGVWVDLEAAREVESDNSEGNRRGNWWKVVCREGPWATNVKEETHDTDARYGILSLSSPSQHDICFVLGEVELGLLGC